jgi:dTDP-4-amino-4,6-dideoxygalactose transaminase
MNVPVTKPCLGEEEIQAVADRLLSGWVVQGPKVREFEESFAAYTGARFARATTSCTTALHLALLALGVGPGDEVLVPAFTFVATANAVLYCGARPVFVDIDLPTFNMDVTQIESRITRQTKVILPVHEFGLSADMGAILSLAEKHKLIVVEDAACACGARYQGQHVGTFGKMGCFSFHPRKAITTGEGGMITTGDEELARRIEVLRSHGALASDLARHQSKVGFVLPQFDELGYNYRMTDIQGAIGVEQMRRLGWILEQRSARAERYTEKLAGIPGLRTPFVPTGYTHVYQSYVTLMEAGREERDRMALALQEQGIATRQGTHAVHALGLYRERFGIRPEDYPRAWRADQQSMTLPLYATMTDEEQDYVVEQVQEVFRK